MRTKFAGNILAVILCLLLSVTLAGCRAATRT